MSKETVKRDFKLFIETYLPSLNGKIKSSFPQASAISPPLVVIEIPISSGTNTIKSGHERTTKYRRLIRIYFVEKTPKKVEDLVDLFCQQYNDNIEFFTTCHPFSVSMVTDVFPLFEEKYGFYVSKIDIDIIEFI